MPIDFYTALRSRAREKERSARLSGRPLTSAEATAPYVALAETAGERLRVGKSIQLAEKRQETQKSQFSETLDLNKKIQAENVRLEEERLTEKRTAEAARLKEQKRATNLQVAAAEEAGKREERVGYIQAGTAAATTAILAISAGLCCFIFVASCGSLHPVVRRYRDLKMNRTNRRGYCWLADRLVPLMAGYPFINWLVKWFMVKPMTSYGKYYFEYEKKGFIWAGLTKAWLLTFTLLGKRPPYKRRGTQEIV